MLGDVLANRSWQTYLVRRRSSRPDGHGFGRGDQQKGASQDSSKVAQGQRGSHVEVLQVRLEEAQKIVALLVGVRGVY